MSRRFAALVAVAVVVGPACSEGTPHAGPSTPGTARPASSAAAATTPTPAGATGPAASGSAAPGIAPGPTRSAAPGASGPASAPSGSPRATPSYPTDVPVTASVSPSCVVQGGTVTVTVHTRSKAAVAFGARYADGGYGAAPPYGKGYGGSGHGFADEGGTYTASWAVAANAPPGQAVVDVLVGSNGKAGSTRPAFTVRAVTSSC